KTLGAHKVRQLLDVDFACGRQRTKMPEQPDERWRFSSQGRRLAEKLNAKRRFSPEPLARDGIPAVLITKLTHVVLREAGPTHDRRRASSQEDHLPRNLQPPQVAAVALVRDTHTISFRFLPSNAPAE